MTGISRSSEGLAPRRKRLLYRAWHRGTREMDLIVGRFAEAHIETMSDDEIADLERLIEYQDQDLYAAFTGAGSLPEGCPETMFARMKAFRTIMDGL